jgi:hypothetical protein
MTDIIVNRRMDPREWLALVLRGIIVALRARWPIFARRGVGVIHHKIVFLRPRAKQVRDIERTVVAAHPRNELDDLRAHEKLSQSATRINNVNASAIR